MTIAWRRNWRTPETARLAEALDQMGFRKDVDKYLEYCERRGMNREEERYAISEMIEQRMEDAHERLWSDTDEMEHELIRYKNEPDIDYDAISMAYITEIFGLECFNIKPARTQKNGKKSTRGRRS